MSRANEMCDNSKYLDLITSEYATKEKFNAYVKAFVDMVCGAWNCLISFDTIFVVDNAVGDQLDKIADYFGLTRELPFSDPDVPSVLDDELLRIVIKSRILSNHWDGTLIGWRNIITTMFPDASYSVVDNQDMSIDVVMIDPGASMAKIGLLFNGYIVPKPSGVNVNWTIQDKPLFGWDADTAFIKGWDQGIWSDS